MQRKYTKIKYNPNKVECYFSFRTDNGNEYTVKSKDLPLPSFIETLSLLDQWVLEMCELPQEYLGRIATHSVSLNYSDDDVMGATLTAQMELYCSNCPLNLNTPNKPESPYNPDADWDAVTCLPTECAKTIYMLCREADKYLDGHMAQGDLFDQDKENVADAVMIEQSNKVLMPAYRE